MKLQTSNLQWVLTVIPAMKSLVMGLSFVFWYESPPLPVLLFQGLWPMTIRCQPKWLKLSTMLSRMLSTPSWCLHHQRIFLGEFVSFTCSLLWQVFVLTLKDVFLLGSIWGIRITNLLRDSMLCYLFVNILWLLHHA